MKNDYFPFVAILGPDWKYTLVLLCFPWIVWGCGIGTMLILSCWKKWAFWILTFILILDEWSILTTALSNPGIVFRGTQPFSENAKLQCKMCRFDRPSAYCHHCYECDLCCYKVVVSTYFKYSLIIIAFGWESVSDIKISFVFMHL